jgi:hypothetical protein
MPTSRRTTTAQVISELQSDSTLREEFVRALGDGIATKLDLLEQGRILERHTVVLEELTEAVKEQGKRIEEQGKHIEEQGRRIEDQGKRIEEQGKRVEEAFRRVEALGARWGLHSEEAFREGMRSVLEQRFSARVHHWEGFDPEGLVFGHPASIELDLVVSNGGTLVIEVKSHVSSADMAAFERKAKLYDQQTGKHAARLVVSPSVEPRALKMAQELGIEVSTHLG